jgi:hypothetical protein
MNLVGKAPMPAYHARRITDRVHLFGPHVERFWPGHFAPLLKRFTAIAQAIEDKASREYADAKRLIDMIPLGRADFDSLPEQDKPAWLVNMPVVELADSDRSLLVYSPIPLDAAGRIRNALDELGQVRVVVAPSYAHTAGLAGFRDAYPDALFLCPRAGNMYGVGLDARNPELRFHRVLQNSSSIARDPKLSRLLGTQFELEVTQDDMLCEALLLHRPSRTVLSSDTIYKPDPAGAGPGPGGPHRQYLTPDWFASAYQVLNLDPSPNRTLPDNRVFLARHPKFDSAGMARSLRRVLDWEFDWMLCGHTDPLPGPLARQAIQNSWGWLMEVA